MSLLLSKANEGSNALSAAFFTNAVNTAELKPGVSAGLKQVRGLSYGNDAKLGMSFDM